MKMLMVLLTLHYPKYCIFLPTAILHPFKMPAFLPRAIFKFFLKLANLLGRAWPGRNSS